MKPLITRRNFVRSSLVLGAALPSASSLAFANRPGSQPTIAPVHLSWLGDEVPKLNPGVTWGVPWPKGSLKEGTAFSLVSSGEKIPLQTWTLGYWPDGSLKWTGHAAPSGSALSGDLVLSKEEKEISLNGINLVETRDNIKVDTGCIQCVIEKEGDVLISSLNREGTEIAKEGRLILIHQDRIEPDENGVIRTDNFKGEIGNITVEQKGPVRAVIKIEGSHVNGHSKKLMPFIIRLYFYSGGESVRIMHTIIYDGDEDKDFIKGIGIRFSVPMNDLEHNRHVRFVGEGGGVFAEAVKGLTGLRRNPGKEVTEAQVEGRATPSLDLFPTNVSSKMKYIPSFGDYTLIQPNSESFEIKKRTKLGHTWLNSAYGRRSSGVGYLGTPKGGIAFGIRNFWQSHPAQLDICNAATENAEVTMWLWAPEAATMDLRFYHDGMGQDTYEKQLEAMDITYEDFEPGFGTANGVARTSEMMLWILETTPSNENLVEIAETIKAPSLLVCDPAYMQSVNIFGGAWSLPDRSSPTKEKIEEQLDWYFNYYENQIDQRKWYGFWNYGDVMHSYDQDRHVWKYDVGGFAWDNSELSTDLWLWYYFLRTGRKDVFRMAEAMTRHTGEVDVHHIGPFAPLGSRHNVLHWGCSAKQLRISTAANRRFYYFLTGDERVGDLLREQVDGAESLLRVQPTRKLPKSQASADLNKNEARISFGTDWGALAAAWLTEWERTQNKEIKERLLNSMRTIAAQPHRFFSGGASMNIDTGEFAILKGGSPTASHLFASFGLPELCFELLNLIDMPSFKSAWLEYCELYNASNEEQAKRLGRSLGSLNLRQGHSRLTAFVANYKDDPALAERAWNEFYRGTGGITRDPVLRHVAGSIVLNPVDEATSVSTNGVAQWGLAAMQCLALVGDNIPVNNQL